VKAVTPPPAPTTFKAIGYVEKAGGQLEAIILQENQIQVVHMGDLIAGRYRVTKVSPDVVDAIDETLAQSPMAKPDGAKSDELTASVAQQPSAPPALAVPAEPATPHSRARKDGSAPPESAEAAPNSLGFVQKADGKVETVVADGDTVRLVPGAPAVTMAQAAPPGDSPRGVSPARISTTPAASDTQKARGDSSNEPGEIAALPLDLVARATRPDSSGSRPWSGDMAETAMPQGITQDVAQTSSPSTVTAQTPMDQGVSPLLPFDTQQASYQAPAPAPDAAGLSAPERLDTTSAGEAAEATAGTNDSAPSSFAQGRGMAILAMTGHGQDPDGSGQVARATGPGGAIVSSAKQPIEMKPLGFVVKANGELAAILSEDDEVYVVRQGDLFAGRYRALSVSAGVVEAVEESPREATPFASPLAFPDLLSAQAEQGPSPFSSVGCLDCEAHELGEVSPKLPEDPVAEVASPPPRPRGTGDLPRSIGVPPILGDGQESVLSGAKDGHNTFIFLTLGYVETQDGEMQAIVADGSQVYLVKQGEVFAGQYRATSVDPILVLAVKVSPGQATGNFLSTQTESGGKPASNILYGYLHYPLAGWANIQALGEVGASSSPVPLELGMNLDSSLTGFDWQGYLFMADDPTVGF
jgi:Tfp pilus assembly protein PilP